MTHPSSDSRIDAPEPTLDEPLRGRFDTADQKAYAPDDGPLSPAQIAALQAVADVDMPKGTILRRTCLFS